MEKTEILFNTQSICWNVAFVLGLFCFLFGIIYLLCKKGIREEHFLKAGILEFIGCWIMYIPEELFNDIPESLPFLEIIESVFTALLRSFNIYLGNGYERVAFEDQPVFSSIYAILMTCVNIVLLLFVAGFFIRFLDGPFQRMKLSINKRRYSYIFSVCNDKTLAIANSIDRKKCNIIFATTDKRMESDEKQGVDAIEGIYVDISIPEILKKIARKSKGVEIFLFGNREEDNLSQLEEISNRLDENIRSSIRIFVELSDTPWSLYDNFLKEHNSVEGDKLVINFVRTEENFAYNHLLKNSIFDNALTKFGSAVKEIKFLLVGMNERNLEMLKAVLHLAQMPGYRLTVMILDDKAGWHRLRKWIPEVHDECDKEGNAIYKIIYKENIDFNSEKLVEIIEKEYIDFTFAFINAGKDIINANIAMLVNAVCFRHNRKDMYKIHANVKNQKVCKNWNTSLTERIEFVGELEKTYNYGFLTMSDIEKGSIAIHEVRYPKGTPKYKSWISYCNNEYNRHSVYARTLSFKHKVKIIHDMYDPEDELKGSNEEWDIYKITATDQIWKIYEHMRWNMYTRTMGLVLAKKELLNEDGEIAPELRAVAMVHNDLVDYSELSPDEQDKDALKLTPEIVKILRSI